MKKEQLTELGLSEEVAVKILDLFDEEVKDLIPKEKLAEYEEQLKAANSALNDRDKQLNILKREVGDNEELKNRISQLQEDNKQQKADYEAQITSIRLNAAVDAALTKAGARNIKAAKALLNMDTISLGEKGEAVGLDEQLTELAKGEDTGFMFAPLSAAGFVPGSGVDFNDTDPKDMNYEQWCAYLEAHPDAN